MNRKTIYTIAIILIIFFVFLNPFRKRRTSEVPPPYVRSDTVEMLSDYITANFEPPAEYLASKFRDHSIVFVGEFGFVKQQVDVIRQAIPKLYERGVRVLAVEFALFEDTPRIDEILTADAYDEIAVHEVLFNRLVIWGFDDYAQLFQAAWEINANRSEGEEPFRIVGLSVPIQWEFLVKERDMRDPEVIAKVYKHGAPDEFMAKTIIDEFVRKDVRALVYTSLQHVFTKFVITDYAERARELGLNEDRRAGNIVYDRIGSDATTVIFHAPWPYNRSQALVTHPAEGAIAKLLESLPEEYHFAGFDTHGTPFGDLDSERNDFAKGHDDLTLGQLCDGYIITGPITAFEPVTQIPGFITDDNLEEALRRFPGPNMDPVSAEELNTYIGSLIENSQKIFERFD